MKCLIFVDHNPGDGGGYFQSINTIADFVHAREFMRNEMVYEVVCAQFSDKSFSDLPKSVFRMNQIQRYFHEICIFLLKNTPFKNAWNILLKNIGINAFLRIKRADLVLFLSPNPYAKFILSVPYVVCIWDLCHVNTPEFPETRNNFQWNDRERLYKNILPVASMVVCDCEQTANNVSAFYRVNSNKIVIVPFSPPSRPRFENTIPEIERLTADDRLKLILYPAQYWTHKNHKYLLEAIARADRDLRKKFVFVFVGGDKGNRANLVGSAATLRVSQHIIYLDYVSDRDMDYLFSVAWSVVMPTYFGPTNLPPLEGMAYGKPVFYPDQQVGFGVYGDAVIDINLDQPEELLIKMERLAIEQGEYDRQASVGRTFLDQYRSNSTKELGIKIDHLCNKIRCLKRC